MKSEPKKSEPKTTSIAENKTNPLILKFIESGIPVSRAEFHAAVNNVEGVPENMFSEKSDHKGRRADMWWTPAGLICHQHGKYFVAPVATVRYAHFK